MARLRDLRVILQRVVLAGLPLSASLACTSFDDGTAPTLESNHCLDVFERHWDLDANTDDGALRLRIESCRMDVDACEELCQFVMDKAAIGDQPDTCEVEFAGADVSVDVKHSVETYASGCAVEGRRPAGLAAPDGPTARSIAGAWLAHAAWLEGASIYAFAHLAEELEAFGAPASLVRGALSAVSDEVRHTEIMSSLAHRYGARPSRVRVDPIGARSIVELAIENMAEGCVRETWGAVLALWQSRTAADPVVRAAFATIARDELRHASLAWAIHRWIAPQLDAEALARVAATRETYARELLDSGELAIAIAALGLPDETQTRGLLARTYDSLWTQGGLS